LRKTIRFCKSALLAFGMAALARGGNPQCYQFSGGGATLEIEISSFVSQQDDQTNSSGYTSKDTFQGNNSLTVGGTTQTSQSTSNSPDCVGCLLGSAVYSYAGTGLTVFTMTVPANDIAGSMNAWLVSLGGVGNLFPTGVLPSSTNFPSISSWAVNAEITVESGAGLTEYPITSIGSCSLGGGGGSSGSAPSIGAVVSASSFGEFSAAAPGSWVEIYGTNLASTTTDWTGLFTGPTGDTAPTTIDGVWVSIGGQPAFLDYISPTQVNAQIPSNLPTGSPLLFTLTNGSSTSTPLNLMINAAEPGLLATSSFKVGGNQYVVAQHADGTYVLPTGTIPGSRPAQPGETITIFGVGFGPVTPIITAGEITYEENQLTGNLQFSFGGTAAPLPLAYSGLAPNLVGLYQFDVVVPTVAASNLVPLTFTLNGVGGTQTLFTAVQ
jgi:uncharacterized protein (TIGR03437 family)